MAKTLAEVESIVRNRICNVCSDRNDAGDCGREDPSTCALFRLFPQVTEAILSTDSNDIRHYIDALRAKVCSVCINENSDHSCAQRAEVRCALDAYLILVVDAIEEATAKKFDRSLLPPPVNFNVLRYPAQG